MLSVDGQYVKAPQCNTKKSLMSGSELQKVKDTEISQKNIKGLFAFYDATLSAVF